MKGIEHLTENQIAGYRAGAFDALETREIGRHLLKCESCRQSLPVPTFDDFWKAVMNERKDDEQDSASEKTVFSLHSIFPMMPAIFKQFNGLAWSGAALILVLSISSLLWFNQTRQSNQEKELAQTFNTEIIGPNPAKNETNELLIPQNSRIDKQSSLSDSNRLLNPKPPQASVRRNNLNLSSQEDSSRNSVRKIPMDKPDSISSTRGVLPAKCGSETTVETEAGVSGENVTLKWNKIPNAVKYHLYISDDEEILIDEYETERETSYLLKKSLDAAKTYQWKVVVTTEDGKTIVGDSQKFTIKNLQLNRNKSEKKEKPQIRCSQTN